MRICSRRWFAPRRTRDAHCNTLGVTRADILCVLLGSNYSNPVFALLTLLVAPGSLSKNVTCGDSRVPTAQRVFRTRTCPFINESTRAALTRMGVRGHVCVGARTRKWVTSPACLRDSAGRPHVCLRLGEGRNCKRRHQEPRDNARGLLRLTKVPVPIFRALRY